uniref:peptidylprolyl isomerase n=1 Tax=Arion vulgaris TaxID=1028688 RepID=A0A0B6XYW8_9EUPU
MANKTMDLDGKLTDQHKLSKVREFKERGNAAYKDGKFHKAAGSYHRAILYLKGLSVNCPDILGALVSEGGGGASSNAAPKMSTEMIEEVRVLTCECYNNLAACMLKDSEPKYERIIQHCNTALEASPNNVKALFRKGTSQYALRDYQEALKTFEKAPPDPSIMKYTELCKAGMKMQDREMAARMKNMFKS